MIVCIRTVHIPPEARTRFLAWVGENRELREEHGILFELVLERSARQNPPKALQPAKAALGEGDEAVVITAWDSHDAFDAWIDTPDRDSLTASDVHRSVEFGPITRLDMAGGYLNVDALAAVASPREETA